jgi:hypothetical protein
MPLPASRFPVFPKGSFRALYASALIFGSAAAQDFRLEDYEPADFHRHFLSLTPNLDLGVTTYRGSGSDADQFHRIWSGSPYLELAYGSRAWSPMRSWKIGAKTDVQASGNLANGRSGNGTPDQPYESEGSQSDRSASAGFQVDARYRRYIRGLWYLEPSVQGRLSLSPEIPSRSRGWSRGPNVGSDSARFYLDRRRSQSFSHVESAGIGIPFGWGRIVDVGFASTALFMLDRWGGSGSRAPVLDGKSMHDLEAYLESRRKQRPFFDRRRAAIYDMVSVQRFLEKTGGQPVPAEALLAMADEWANPSPLPRERGWEVKLQPTLSYYWNYSRYSDRRLSTFLILPADESPSRIVDALEKPDPDTLWYWNRSFTGLLEYGLGIRWEYRHPWRRHFQFSASSYLREVQSRREMGGSASGYGLYSPGYDNPGYYAYRHPRTEAGLSGWAAWIPDSRAYLRLTGSASGVRFGRFDPISDRLPFDSHPKGEVNGTLACEGWYEVAPRLAADARVQVDTQWNDDQMVQISSWNYGYSTPYRESRSTDVSARVRLTYYLF